MKEYSARKKVAKTAFGNRISTNNLKDGTGLFVCFEQGKQNGGFIVVKLTEEDFRNEKPKKENILSTIKLNNEAEVFGGASKLGKAIQETLRSSTEQISNYDFVNELQKKLKEILPNATLDYNKNIVFPTGQKQQSTYRQNGYQNGGYQSRFEGMTQDIDDLKPVVAIEELARQGYIRIIKEEDSSGNEVKIKYVFNDTATHGNTEFNTAVKRKGYLYEAQANQFNDFMAKKSGNSKAGSVGLMIHLMEHGMFGESLNTDPTVLRKKAIDFVKNNLLPQIPRTELVASLKENTNGLSLADNHDHIATMANKDTLKLISDFLLFRGMKQDTIDKLVERNSLATGDIYIGLVKKAMAKGGTKEKENYFNSNQAFFRLSEGKGNTYVGAERFEIARSPAGSPKPFIYDKKNVGGISGRYWEFGEHENPEFAMFHEAIIDGLSSYEFLKETDSFNADKVKYLSVQSTNGLTGFFKYNFGLDIEFKDNGWTQLKKCELKTFTSDITPDVREKYQETLGHKDIVFFDYENIDNSEIHNQIKMIQEATGLNIRTENRRENGYVNWNEYDRKRTIIFDNYNFKDFVSSVGLGFENNKVVTKNQYRGKPVNIKKEEYRTFVQQVKKEIIDFLGTDKLSFALDNDEAGLKHVKFFTELEKHFDLKVSYFIPNDHINKNTPLVKNIFKSEQSKTEEAIVKTHSNIKDLMTRIQQASDPKKKEEFENGLKKEQDKLKEQNEFIIGQKELFLDNTMEQYNALCKQGKHKDAYVLLDKYIDRRPTIDNNDVLKTYQSLKSSNPSLAKELLESKVKQLDFSPKKPVWKPKKKQNKRPS